MKNIVAFTCIAISIQFTSCLTTKLTEKAAYINNETVNLPNEKATAVTIVCRSTAEEKGLYTKIAQTTQAYMMAKHIPSDMLFFDATEPNVTINAKIHESTKAYYLIFEKSVTSYQKDELNNDMIVKQVPCSLQKSSGEHIADLRIGIDKTTTNEKLGKLVADLVTAYLDKMNLL